MTSGESYSYQGGESNSYQGGQESYGQQTQKYGQQSEQYSEQRSYGGYQRPDIQQAAQYAKQHAPEGDHDEDMFSSILSKVVDRDDDDAPHKQTVNEEEAHQAAGVHDQIYNQNNGQPGQEHSSRDLGSAAAMQAFKMFSGGGGSNGGGSSQLIGLAMGEAMKLFQAQGGAAGGANQAEMLQSAAAMAMKLFMTQQGGQGGGSGGGLSSVMGILGSLQGGGQQQHSSGGGMASLLGKFL